MTTTTKRKKAKKSTPTAEKKAQFTAFVASMRGSMPWLKVSVDSYLDEKHAETDAESTS